MQALLLVPSRPIDPAARGYLAVYRENETNYCPGCGRTHWLIGRTSAECAFCATAIPFDLSLSRAAGRPSIERRGKGGGKVR